MAQIFLWEPKCEHGAHCSLKLDNDFYISFWPCGAYGLDKAFINQTISSKWSTYDKDRSDLYGRSPETTIKIKGKLDNQVIESWHMKNRKCDFSFKNDCLAMVQNALKVGNLKSDECRINYMIK